MPPGNNRHSPIRTFSRNPIDFYKIPLSSAFLSLLSTVQKDWLGNSVNGLAYWSSQLDFILLGGRNDTTHNFGLTTVGARGIHTCLLKFIQSFNKGPGTVSGYQEQNSEQKPVHLQKLCLRQIIKIKKKNI